MYKSKLQELSQQKRWGLPRYTSMKDGLDHLPQFKASVHVNGLSFHSPTISTSSKEAHNLAAKLAFLHFSSSSGSQEHDNGVPNIGEKYHSTEIHTDALDFYDLQYQYKSQLQDYTRRKNLDAPLYSSKHDGPPHALRFKASVTIDGHTYDSPEFFNTLKKAEQAAAKVALMSLLQDDFQEEDSVCYKNVLRDLAQNELFCTPTYETVKCGPSHMPTFFSTVEVNGESFNGKAGKSKKQAEMKAAKVAYAAFKDCALRRGAEFTSPDSPALASSVQVMAFDSQQNHKRQLPFLSPPTIGYEEHVGERKCKVFGYPASTDDQAISVNSENYVIPECPLLSSLPVGCEEHAKERTDEVEEFDSADILSSRAEATTQDTHSSSVIFDFEKMNKEGSSTACTESVPVANREDLVPIMAPLELEASSTEVIKNTSYLLCGRVRVYPYFPDVSFPTGITVLPISDNKWVAISLEFPNEIGN